MSTEQQIEQIVTGDQRDVQSAKSVSDRPKQRQQTRKSKPKYEDIWVSEELAYRNAINKDDY